jgi:hypothetical protein
MSMKVNGRMTKSKDKGSSIISQVQRTMVPTSKILFDISISLLLKSVWMNCYDRDGKRHGQGAFVYATGNKYTVSSMLTSLCFII